MRKIGILGGLAWPSTVEYYSAICKMSQEYHADREYSGPAPMPEMCIESVNINYSYSRRGSPGDESSWALYDAYFNAALRRLEASGADFAVIASNTPHIRFSGITRGIEIPVLSIYESIAETCRKHGISRFLLLGTGPTMNSGVFQEYFNALGIEAFVPTREDHQADVADLISELFTGGCENGRQRLHRLVEAVYDDTGFRPPHVCLACTELPIAFADKKHLETFEENGVFYLNTAMIHAGEAFRFAVS